MSRILLGLFSVMLCFTLGYTLECRKCDIASCVLSIISTQLCEANELCFSGEGTAVGFIPVKMKGCLLKEKCNKTEDVNFPTANSTVYKMYKTCCNTDLCNAAVPLANTHTLTLAIGSLVTLLLTKVLM